VKTIRHQIVCTIALPKHTIALPSHEVAKVGGVLPRRNSAWERAAETQLGNGTGAVIQNTEVTFYYLLV